MPKGYHHPTCIDRCQIKTLLASWLSQVATARQLWRAVARRYRVNGPEHREPRLPSEPS